MLIAPLLVTTTLMAQAVQPPSSNDTRDSMINRAPLSRSLGGGRTLLTINGRRLDDAEGAEGDAPPAAPEVLVQPITQRDGVQALPGCQVAPLQADGPPAPEQSNVQDVAFNTSVDPARQAAQAFVDADTDHDLTLSAEEAKSIHLTGAFPIYDRNGDGRLSMTEFLEAGRVDPQRPDLLYRPDLAKNLNVSPAVLVDGCPASMTAPLPIIVVPRAAPETPSN